MTDGKKIDYTKITEADLTWFKFFINLCSQVIVGTWLYTANRMTVSGRENIIRKPAVIAANHISGIDPPLLAAVFSVYPIAFMAKLELFQSWLGALYYRNVGSFGVDRDQLDKSTIKSAKAVLNKGWYLGVFPEGTRNSDGALQPLKKGAVYLARVGKVPMIPVGIVRSSTSIFAKIHVEIGEPIPFDQDLDASNLVLETTLKALLNKARRKIGIPEL